MDIRTPGTYRFDVSSDPIAEGVSTTVFGFTGVTEKGPLGATFVNGWKDYVEKFGGYTNDSLMTYAVRGFFDNGGKMLYISRVLKRNAEGEVQGTKSQAELKKEEEIVAVIDSRNYGKYYDNLSAGLVKKKNEEIFFEVRDKDELKEEIHIEDIADLEEFVNNTSRLVTLTVIQEELLEGLIPEEDSTLVKLDGGTEGEGEITATDYQYALEQLDSESINFVVAPGATDVATLKVIEAYVEGRQDRNAIIYSPKGLTPVEAQEFFLETAKLKSSRLFPYTTWGIVTDPNGQGKDPRKTIDLSGHVAGQVARVIGSEGIGATPAGTKTVLRGVLDLEYHMTDEEQALLNPNGINAIRSFKGRGILIWGGRTLAENPRYKYISTRTTVDYVGESLKESAVPYVFDKNGATLQKKITVLAEGFLRNMWNKGQLRGSSEDEAFFVVCDSTNNTAEDVENGFLFCDVGIADHKPGEFIVFRVSLK